MKWQRNQPYPDPPEFIGTELSLREGMTHVKFQQSDEERNSQMAPDNKNTSSEPTVDSGVPSTGQALLAADRVFNLCRDLQAVEREKKETVRTFNEDIKRIKAEIKDILSKES